MPGSPHPAASTLVGRYVQQNKTKNNIMGNPVSKNSSPATESNNSDSYDYVTGSCFRRIFLLDAAATLSAKKISDSVRKVVERHESDDFVSLLYMARKYDNHYLKIHSPGNFSSIFNTPMVLHLGTVLGYGSNGTVSLASYKTPAGVTNTMAVKIGIVDERNKIGLLGEALNHSFLLCAMKCILKVVTPLLDGELFEYPIPTLHGVAMVDGDVYMFMRRLELNLHSFLVHAGPHSQSDIYDIFLQIFVKIHYMQLAAEFLHGDLHTGNIMIVKRKNGGKQNRYVVRQDREDRDPLVFVTFSTFRVFFVDFGASCTAPYICKDRYFVFEPASNTYNNGTGRCSKKSFDLLLLLTSLSHELIQGTYKFGTMNPIRLLLENLKSVHGKLFRMTDRNWHKAYDEYLTEYETFKPFSILLWLRQNTDSPPVPNRIPDIYKGEIQENLPHTISRMLLRGSDATTTTEAETTNVKMTVEPLMQFTYAEIKVYLDWLDSREEDVKRNFPTDEEIRAYFYPLGLRNQAIKEFRDEYPISPTITDHLRRGVPTSTEIEAYFFKLDWEKQAIKEFRDEYPTRDVSPRPTISQPKRNMPPARVQIQEYLNEKYVKESATDILSASTLPPRTYDPTVISNRRNDSPGKQRDHTHLRSRTREKLMKRAHPMSIDQTHPMSIDQAYPMSIDPTLSDPAHPMSIELAHPMPINKIR